MALSSDIQSELVDYLSAKFPDKKVAKYDGQLAVEDLKAAALEFPFIFVFYNATEYESVIEYNALYTRRHGFQAIVGSDNIATADSKSDEVLDLKDDIIEALSGADISLGPEGQKRIYTIRVIEDHIIIREKDCSVITINIEILGQR